MIQVYLTAHMVALELACQFVLKEDKDKKMRDIFRICEALLVVCFVASVFFYY